MVDLTPAVEALVFTLQTADDSSLAGVMCQDLGATLLDGTLPSAFAAILRCGRGPGGEPGGAGRAGAAHPCPGAGRPSRP